MKCLCNSLLAPWFRKGEHGEGEHVLNITSRSSSNLSWAFALKPNAGLALLFFTSFPSLCCLPACPFFLLKGRAYGRRPPPSSDIRASLTQEVYTEQKDLLELVLTPLQAVSTGVAVMGIPLHQEKDVKISPCHVNFLLPPHPLARSAGKRIPADFSSVWIPVVEKEMWGVTS